MSDRRRPSDSSTPETKKAERMSSGGSSVPKNVKKDDALAFADTVHDASLLARARAKDAPRRPLREQLEGAITDHTTDGDDSPPTKVSPPEPSKPSNGSDRRGRILRGLKKWSFRLGIVTVVLAVAGLIAGWLLIRHYEEGLPSVAELERGYRPSQVTRVLARDGTALAELFTERRTIVHVEDLPRHVTTAFIAAEDASFYEHEGINYLGIARAAVVNLRAGRTRQGGSTITQQVVKNILLETNERTYRRKMREALLARRLEQELCPSCGTDRAGRDRRKDKILELYLNHIYLGHGRYGIEETAEDCFGKPASKLTIAEAAMLAGIPAAPESYNPKRDLTKALSRRGFVLDQMRAKHFINDAEYEAAKNEPVRLAATREVDSELAPEAVQMAKKLLLELEPERGPRGGFTITTTIDPALQQAARKALRDNVAAYDKRHKLVGPLRSPAVAQKGKPKASPADAPFEGTPKFESHGVWSGVVTATDDVAGTIDVRVGTVIGSVKLADFKRYNPQNLSPSQFAEVGARVRVSLLAPIPNAVAQVTPSPPVGHASGSPSGGDPSFEDHEARHEARPENVPVAKVPLRLELGPESAIVMLDVRTRHVLAVVGSYEAQNGGLDRATHSKRQPGSTFKPVVYSYALHSRRYTPATLVDVQPKADASGYRPTNYEGWTSTDPLRLREVLANSVNVGAVNVLADVGAANVVDWATALGIESKMAATPSLALGAYELKPIELAGVYATFAAGGMYDEPRLVTRIVGPDGKDVELKPAPPSRRVLEPAEAFLITSMLESVVDHGTAQKAKVLGRHVAGKTGTTNDKDHATRDTWFAGFSPEIAAVTWVGYDDNKPLGAGETGGTTALPAWIAVMDAAHKGKPRAEFARPAGVVTVAIDPKTGKLAANGTEGDTIDEVFLAGTEPTETAEPKSADAGAASSEATPAAADSGSVGSGTTP